MNTSSNHPSYVWDAEALDCFATWQCPDSLRPWSVLAFTVWGRRGLEAFPALFGWEAHFSQMLILDKTFWSFTLIKILFCSCHLNKSVFPKSNCEINLKSSGIHEQCMFFNALYVYALLTNISIPLSTSGEHETAQPTERPQLAGRFQPRTLSLFGDSREPFFFFFCFLIVRIEAVNSTRPLKWLWVNRRVSHPASSESSCSFCIAPRRQWMTSAVVSSC